MHFSAPSSCLSSSESWSVAGRAQAVTGTPSTTSANVPNTLYDEAGSDGAYDLIVRVDEALNALT